MPQSMKTRFRQHRCCAILTNDCRVKYAVEHGICLPLLTKWGQCVQVVYVLEEGPGLWYPMSFVSFEHGIGLPLPPLLTKWGNVYRWYTYVYCWRGQLYDTGLWYTTFLLPQPLLVLVLTCFANHITPGGYSSHYLQLALWRCVLSLADKYQASK